MMRWLWRGALVVAIVPSVSLIVVMVLPAFWPCEMNPWNGYTCPSWAAPLVFLSVPGIVTLPALLLMTMIYAAFVTFDRFKR